jgi:hypothetical protein
MPADRLDLSGRKLQFSDRPSQVECCRPPPVHLCHGGALLLPGVVAGTGERVGAAPHVEQMKRCLFLAVFASAAFGQLHSTGEMSLRSDDCRN